MRTYAREIAALLRGSRTAVLLGFLLSAASAAVDMICMVLLPVFLFTTLSGQASLDPRIPFSGVLQGLLPGRAGLVSLVAGAFLLRGALSLFVADRISRLGESIRARITQRLAEHYLTCAYQQFIRRPVSWAQTTMGGYVATFAGSVALPLLRLVLDLLTLVAILLFLLILDFRIVGVLSVVLALAGTVYYLSVRRASDLQSRRLSELQATFAQHLSRALHSPREVRVFQLQSHFLDGLRDIASRTADAQARLVMIGSLPRVLGEFMLIGLALGYLAYRTHSGTTSILLVSQLGLLGFAGLRLLPTFAQILTNISALRAGRHATGLLAAELKLLDRMEPVAPHAGRRPPATRFESLELRDVSFAYEPEGKVVLDGISLRIGRGESVGIMGPSGAGKSTLGDLLLGLLQPSRGEILVNGAPVSLASEDWWNTIGFVPQAVFLSNDTLLRNIALGQPDATIDRERAARAASLAQLDDVVNGLPKGLDTPIGDYGVRLSGGQRQRVAIARALYHERQFLVLDEATSALDSETEKAVVAAVGSLRGSITTFIIAHRTSTLESCDHLVEIADGRLRTVPPDVRAAGGRA